MLSRMDARQRQQMVAGGSLIVLGGLFYVLQAFDRVGYSVFFLLIGGAFLAAYFYAKEFGYLVPACVLLGLGLGQIGRGTILDFGNETLLGLGAGFVAIFVIALVYERRSPWWALIPGGVLIVLGLPASETIIRWLFEHWPVALMLIGLGILLSALFRPRGR